LAAGGDLVQGRQTVGSQGGIELGKQGIHEKGLYSQRDGFKGGGFAVLRAAGPESASIYTINAPLSFLKH
jgi:hypothetical protein